MASIRELCGVIRSKNAGPFEIGLDLVFINQSIYQKVKESSQLNEEFISNLYHVQQSCVRLMYWFDQGCLLKVVIPRSPAGGPGESDLYGDQQHIPLLDVEITGVVENEDLSKPKP